MIRPQLSSEFFPGFGKIAGEAGVQMIDMAAEEASVGPDGRHQEDDEHSVSR